jgi:UDP-N-acetylmuramoyl-tripeptide--D-alanyl-D-alanine ligase
MKWFALATRPDIAVFVNVARTHMQSFRTLETIASEKSLLVEGLRPGGLAVLYGDNPHIAAYQPPGSVRTVRYGEGEGFDWRASNLSSSWPDHFSFQVRSGNEEGLVSTKLIGTHWLPSVMPALVVAREAGLTLKQAIAALENLQPMQQRLSEATTPQGAIFLRDEWNGSVDSLKVALDVMEAAVARRKILVFTDVSDSKQKIRLRQRDMGITAARIVDIAFFIGDSHSYAVKAAVEAGMDPGRVFGFYDIESAGKQLLAELREGDLVLLRGRHADHLSRLYLMALDEVSCWRSSCERKLHCDVCSDLRSRTKSNSKVVQIS